jgi:hypothetical protein
LIWHEGAKVVTGDKLACTTAHRREAEYGDRCR